MDLFGLKKNKAEQEYNDRLEELDKPQEEAGQIEEAGMITPEITGLPEIGQAEEQKTEPKVCGYKGEGIDYRKIGTIFHEELLAYHEYQKRMQQENNKSLSDELRLIMQVLEETGGMRQDIISRQQAMIQEFQRDLSLKLKKELLMELIALADNIRVILADQKEIKQEERDYDELMVQYENLLTEFRNMERWVEATLEDNAVRSFRDAASVSDYNKTRQEIVEIEETEDPELDGKVISDQPGYVYTQPYLIIDTEETLRKSIEENSIPRNFTYVLRNEEVKKYRLKK